MSSMKLFDNIELIDLAIYTNNTLILTDFHIGYEEALNKQGLMIPRFQFQEIMERLDSIFKILTNKNIEQIIINGDLKHEFGTISDQEWRHALRLLDYLGQHCNEIILIKGNHDTKLGPIARKRNVKVLEHYLIEQAELLRNEERHQFASHINKNNKSTSRGMPPTGMNVDTPSNIKEWRADGAPSVSENFATITENIKKTTNKTQQSFKALKTKKLIENKKNKSKNKILVLHGDSIPDKKLLEGVSTIIIGHEHPAVSVREGPRTELFKAYLAGEWHGRAIIVQPSFNLVVEGTDMLKEEVLSPFLKNNLGNFKAIVVADKLYEFGKLKDL